MVREADGLSFFVAEGAAFVFARDRHAMHTFDVLKFNQKGSSRSSLITRLRAGVAPQSAKSEHGIELAPQASSRARSWAICSIVEPPPPAIVGRLGRRFF